MNRRILMSVLAITITLVLVGGATLAYFSDTETSSGNTFTAGTLDLKVSDLDESGDGVSATWTMSNMVPGTTTFGPRSVTLRNDGTIAANHVEISFSHSINDAIDVDVESDTNPASTPGEMARWIEITLMNYNGIDWKAAFIPNDPDRDPNNNGFFDLEDVTMAPYTADAGFLDNLLAPVGAGTTSFQMALKFNAGATNDIQGDILSTTVTFTLNQHSSQ